MHILCPHCRNPIEVVKLTPREEIGCPACGSTFRLETDSTTAWHGTVGQKLGRFEILETVGRGAFGTVHKARDPELDRTVAIKVPRAGNLAGQEELDRFLREARSVAQLRHPSIVSVHEVGQTDGVPFLVSDFVQGVTLADLMAARRPGFREAAELVAAVADALQYAHERGVVHRDVKPSNIMIGDDGRPCVMDFGLAKRDAGEITMTLEGHVLGTPAYMSPEQARGESHQVDGRSDVYSLGVMLYQLLTGELPFRGNKRMLLHQVLHDDPRPPRSLYDKIPRDLETICLKAMAKEPHRRYGTARELAEDLRRWMSGEPIRARPVGVVERGVRWMRRRPAVAGLLGLVVLVTLMAFVLVTWQWRQADAARQAEARARGEAETNLYFTNLALAGRQFLGDGRDVEKIEALLDACPERVRGWEWHVLRRLCRHEPRVLFRQPGMVGAVAFSPDRRLLAVAHFKDVKLVDAATGAEIRTLAGHTNLIQTLAFRPDGKLLAAGGEDRTIRTWDVATGEPRLTYAGHRDWVGSVVFHPDGRRIASADGEGVVRVWDAATGKEVRVLDGHTDAARRIAFHPDGSLLASGSWDQTVKVWDVETGRLRQTLRGHSGWVETVLYSPDGRHLVSGGSDLTAKVWDAASGELLFTLSGHDKTVESLAFTADGTRLATGAHDGTIRVWEVRSGREVLMLPAHDGGVYGLSFSADGQVLASAAGGTVKLWGAEPLEERTVAREKDPCRATLPHGAPARWVAYSPDGRHLATAGGSRGQPADVVLWDVANRAVVRRVPGHADVIYCVAYSGDGTRLASAGHDGTVRVWDLKGGSLQHTLTGHEGQVFCVAFGPGNRLATVGADRTVRLWDAVAGKLMHTLKGHTEQVRGVVFSPDGRYVASEGLDGKLKLWEVGTAKQAGSLNDFRGYHVAFSPNGQRLAIATASGVVLWNPQAPARRLRVLDGNRGVVSTVAFSPDGKRLASAGGDRTVKLWDVATYRELATLRGHGDSVWCVTFSPDGKTAASASEDGTVRVWDVTP